MAETKVILSQGIFVPPTFAQGEDLTCFGSFGYGLNCGMAPTLSSFWNQLWDTAGNVVESIGNAYSAGIGGLANASVNITQGLGTGVGSYVSDPNNIAQIANMASFATTGFNPGLTNQAGRQSPYWWNPQGPGLNQLVNNPLVWVAGLGILYLATKKQA